jgi:hypothetical protein
MVNAAEAIPVETSSTIEAAHRGFQGEPKMQQERVARAIDLLLVAALFAGQAAIAVGAVPLPV